MVSVSWAQLKERFDDANPERTPCLIRTPGNLA